MSLIWVFTACLCSVYWTLCNLGLIRSITHKKERPRGQPFPSRWQPVYRNMAKWNWTSKASQSGQRMAMITKTQQNHSFGTDINNVMVVADTSTAKPTIKTSIEKSRVCHSHKLQPTPDTKWKRKRTEINAYKINQEVHEKHKDQLSISYISEVITMLNTTEQNKENKEQGKVQHVKTPKSHKIKHWSEN